MSIKQQVTDALTLAKSGSPTGALTQLLLAVAASSRRTFPKGTISIEKPPNTMGDGEAFTRFLGDRIRRIVLRNLDPAPAANSGFSVSFKGKPHDIAFILYKFYRCELVHDAELPTDVLFVPAPRPPTAGTLSVSVSAGDKVALDHGWLDVLAEAVMGAECNAKEFGRVLVKLRPKGGHEAAIKAEMCKRFSMSPGAYHILRHAVGSLRPVFIETADANENRSAFLGLVKSGQVNGGMVTGLRGYELSDWDGVLTDKGLEALKCVAASFEVVEVGR